jgi:hypothetical protein
MKFREGNIPGLLVVEPDVFSDDRGFFLELEFLRILGGGNRRYVCPGQP